MTNDNCNIDMAITKKTIMWQPYHLKRQIQINRKKIGFQHSI